MRWTRTWVAVLATALALLATGCPRICETSDRAPVPDGVTPRFGVLAYDETRTEITLLDEVGTPIEFPEADDPAELTDIWLDATYEWEDQLATIGIGLDGRMPWTQLPGGGLTIATARYGRELVRFPFDTSPPQELRTTPMLLARPEASGGQVLDLFVSFASETPDDEDVDTLYALRAPGVDGETAFGQDVLVFELDPENDEGGAVVDSISLIGTVEGAPPRPERMVPRFDRLYVGLDGYQAQGSAEGNDLVAPAALAIVDPAGRRVVGTFRYDATDQELFRCAEVAPSLDPTSDPTNVVRLVVACRGVGGDVTTRAESAGIVELLVERDPDDAEREPVVTLENVWSSQSFFATLPSRGLVPLPGRAAAFVSAGSIEETLDDALYVVDLDSEEAIRIRVASAPLFPDELSGMGTGAFLPEGPESGLLVWPLARRGVLRRRIRTVTAADGEGRDVVVCPSDHSACLPEDEALEDPVDLCNSLLVDQVRLLDAPPPAPVP
ncbi:hypothetical protein [Sandaracinus amylolyticus]|uniref:Lipoprotein n=1 Tax=Sandaracinus amylolyticus TaxID=927083 RepID=A0A0F6W594_9BACT|nr:hypothetical protein [Sandaracinus amylolyticus]AKF07825.1 hypothetical protein DB32_004974 [Sandaracinus amylolyticus]